MPATNVVTEERRVSESGSGQGSMYPLPARSATLRHIPAPSVTEPRNRYNLFENLGATLAHLAYSKSIWLESGSNQLFFFAYLTVLWTIEIDIAREWEQSHFQNAIHSSLLKGCFQDASDDIAENLAGFRLGWSGEALG